jgi:glucose-1-phosphate thymidylyltransferase
VQTVEHRQGLKVACLEEIAFHQGLDNKRNFVDSKLTLLKRPSYGEYLAKVAVGYK